MSFDVVFVTLVAVAALVMLVRNYVPSRQKPAKPASPACANCAASEEHGAAAPSRRGPLKR
jgi:hypothetical protein